jgi:hypothetical protein
MKIDIMRFVRIADLTEQQKKTLRRTLEARRKELQAATDDVDEALALLESGGAPAKKGAKKAGKKK